MRAPYITVLICFLIISLPIVSAVQLSYDANGNLLNDGDFRYIYNDFNNLIEVMKGDSSVVRYFYDSIGRRIKKIAGDETTLYLGDLVTVIKNGETIDTVYYKDDYGLVAKEENNEIEYYHPDHLGSPVLISNDKGEIVSESTYLPFGLSFSGDEDRYGFTAQEKDSETTLQYYNARYYSPVLRQFTQPDSILPDIYDPQQLNRNSYVRNNPVKYTDPSGHCIWDLCIVEGYVAAVATAIVAAAVITAATYAIAYTYEYFNNNQFEFPSPTNSNDLPLEMPPVLPVLPINEPYYDLPVDFPGQGGYDFPLDLPSLENPELEINLNNKNRIEKINKQDSPIWKDIQDKTQSRKGNEQYKTDGELTYRWDKTHGDIEVYKNIGGNKIKELHSIDPKTGLPYRWPKDPRIETLK